MHFLYFAYTASFSRCFMLGARASGRFLAAAAAFPLRHRVPLPRITMAYFIDYASFIALEALLMKPLERDAIRVTP